MNAAIAAARLDNHGLVAAPGATPEEVVAWLGAVQAQDSRAAVWAVGLRSPDDTTAETVQQALDEGRILRTHVLRPTWHFVTSADIHWMLQLTSVHVQRRTASYYKHLGIDDSMRQRAAKVIERALATGEHRTRAELGIALQRAGLPASGVGLAVLTLHAELEGIMCSGRRRGTQATYAALAARAPRPHLLPRDEAIAELSRRYLRSHAPATIRDFVWWSGLSTLDAMRGFEAIGARREPIGDHVYWRMDDGVPSRKRPAVVHLLPIYDEYLVAYRDLHAVPRPPARSGVLPQAVLGRGEVTGTWKVARRRDSATIEISPLRPMTATEERALRRAAARYGRFFGVPHTLIIHS